MYATYATNATYCDVNVYEFLCRSNMNPLDPCVECGQVRCMQQNFDIELPYKLEVLTVRLYFMLCLKLSLLYMYLLSVLVTSRSNIVFLIIQL